MSNVISSIAVEASGTGRTRDEIVSTLEAAKQKASEASKAFNELTGQTLASAAATNELRIAKNALKTQIEQQTSRVQQYQAALKSSIQTEREELAILEARLKDIQRLQAAEKRPAFVLGLAQSYEDTSRAITRQKGVIEAYTGELKDSGNSLANLKQQHVEMGHQIREAEATQSRLNIRTKEAGQAYRQANGEVRTFTGELRTHEQQQKKVEDQTNKVTSANLAMANVLGNVVYNALRTLTAGVLDFIKDAVIYAARTDEMSIAMMNMGRVTGHTRGEILAHEESIKSLNITTQQARETLTKFMLADLDLGKASQLARVAQDLAVVVGVETSEELERLTRGIATLQIRTLRTGGVFVNLADAERKAALASGRALNSFSEQEKQQILLNEVLDFGARATGTYGESLENAGKRMRSMTRIFQEMQNAIGGLLQGPFGDLIDLLSGLMKLVTKFPMLFAGAAVVFGTVAAAIAINVIATTSWGKSLDNLIVKLMTATGAARIFGSSAVATAGKTTTGSIGGKLGLGGAQGTAIVGAGLLAAELSGASALETAGSLSRLLGGAISAGSTMNEEELRQKINVVKVNYEDVKSLNEISKALQAQGEAYSLSNEQLLKEQQVNDRLLPTLRTKLDLEHQTAGTISDLAKRLEETNKVRVQELDQQQQLNLVYIRQANSTLPNLEARAKSLNDELLKRDLSPTIEKFQQFGAVLAGLVGTVSPAFYAIRKLGQSIVESLSDHLPSALLDTDLLRANAQKAADEADKMQAKRKAAYQSIAQEYLELSKVQDISIEQFEKEHLELDATAKDYALLDGEIRNYLGTIKKQADFTSEVTSLQNTYNEAVAKAGKANLDFADTNEVLEHRLAAVFNQLRNLPKLTTVGNVGSTALSGSDVLTAVKPELLGIDDAIQKTSASTAEYQQRWANLAASTGRPIGQIIDLVSELRVQSAKTVQGFGEDAAKAARRLSDVQDRLTSLVRELRGIFKRDASPEEAAAAQLEQVQRRMELLKQEAEAIQNLRINLGLDVGKGIPEDRNIATQMQHQYEQMIKTRDAIRETANTVSDFQYAVAASQQEATKGIISYDLLAAKAIADNQKKRLQGEQELTAQIIALSKDREERMRQESKTQNEANADFFKQQLEALDKLEVQNRNTAAALAVGRGWSPDVAKGLPIFSNINTKLANIPIPNGTQNPTPESLQGQTINTYMPAMSDNVSVISQNVAAIAQKLVGNASTTTGDHRPPKEVSKIVEATKNGAPGLGSITGTIEGGSELGKYGFNPQFELGLSNLFSYLRAGGVHPSIRSGVRTAEQQKADYDKGLPTPFTGAPGSMSTHQLKMAADLGFGEGERARGVLLMQQWASMHPEFRQAGIVKNRFGKSFDDRTHIQLGSSSALNGIIGPDGRSYDFSQLVGSPAFKGISVTSTQAVKVPSQTELTARARGAYQGAQGQLGELTSGFQSGDLYNLRWQNAYRALAEARKKDEGDFQQNQATIDRIHTEYISKYDQGETYKSVVRTKTLADDYTQTANVHTKLTGLLEEEKAAWRETAEYKRMIDEQVQTQHIDRLNASVDALNTALAEEKSGYRQSTQYKETLENEFKTHRIKMGQDSTDKLNELLIEEKSGFYDSVEYRTIQWQKFEANRIETSRSAKDRLAELDYQIAHVHDQDANNVETARKQAILETLQLDNKAEADMAGNAVRLADAQIFHAARSNSQIIDFLMQQKSVDSIVADSRIGVMQSFFNAIDSGLDRVTRKLGIFGDLVKQVVGDFLKFALTRTLGSSILGVGGGGAASTGGVPGILNFFSGGIGGVSGGAAQQIGVPGIGNLSSLLGLGGTGGGYTGGGSVGGGSVGGGVGLGASLTSLIQRQSQNFFGGGPAYQTMPVSSSLPSGITGIIAGGGLDLINGGGLGLHEAGHSIGLGAAGSLGRQLSLTGLLKGIAPALGVAGVGLGAQLGYGLGGPSKTGSILGLLGGGIGAFGLLGGLSLGGFLGAGGLGAGFGTATGLIGALPGFGALSGLFTGLGSSLGLSSGAISALGFAGPLALIAAPLIIGAIILSKNAKRRAAEKQRAQVIGDSLTQLQQLLDQVRHDKIGGAEALAQAAGIREAYIKSAEAITDSKTRRIALQDVSRLDVVIAQIKAAAAAQDKRRQFDDTLKPEFAGGGLVSTGSGFQVPGFDTGFDTVSAMLRPHEVVLNQRQQAYLGGPAAMAAAGVPGFSRSANYSTGGYAPAASSRQGGNTYIVFDKQVAEKLAEKGKDKILEFSGESITDKRGSLYRALRTM